MTELEKCIKAIINSLPDSAIEEAREIWGNTNTNIIKKNLSDCREALRIDKSNAKRA